MSRTHAHQPWWVNFADPSVCYGAHDHREGECDLPPLAEWRALVSRGEQPWSQYRCSWEVDFRLVPPSCGCRVCTDGAWRRDERRRARRQAKEAVRREDW